MLNILFVLFTILLITYFIYPTNYSIPILLALLITLWIITSRLKEEWKAPYLYKRGNVIGGTVYAEDPYNTPGLGWIL